MLEETQDQGQGLFRRDRRPHRGLGQGRHGVGDRDVAAAIAVGPLANRRVLSALTRGSGPLYEIADSEVWDVPDPVSGRGYQVFVALPPSYAKQPQRRYPIVYLLDGDSLFRRTGPHELKVVTCGGRWLDERMDYSDNVIVTAVLE